MHLRKSHLAVETSVKSQPPVSISEYLIFFNCRMVKPLWNINPWRMQIPQTYCVPARFVSSFINYGFPVSSVRVCILMLTVSANLMQFICALYWDFMICIVLGKGDNLIFVCLIVWRTPAPWWSGRRVQKTTLTVLLTISWAMKPSGTWSMLSHSEEKSTHMEMVNNCTSIKCGWNSLKIKITVTQYLTENVNMLSHASGRELCVWSCFSKTILFIVILSQVDQTTQMTGTSGPSLLMCVTSGLSQSNVKAGHTSLSAWRMAQHCQLFISTREGAQHSWIAWGNWFRSTSKWSVRGWFCVNRSGLICGSAVDKYCAISVSRSFYLWEMWTVCQCCFLLQH